MKKKSFTSIILDSISDGVFTVDHNWKITSFNKAAEKITGIEKKDAIGKICADVFRSSMCGDACPLQKTLKNQKSIIGKSGYIINSEAKKIPISVSTAVLKDEKGNVKGGAETFRDLSEIDALRKELDKKFRSGNIVSQNPLMLKVFSILPAISISSSTVLIQGETGTGKEMIAKNIHNLSSKKNFPFIAVNCAALPESLLESELFGYKKGAFTGANKDKKGRFALARGGTLFLDEIGEINPNIQAKLLRVLQDKSFEPLGSTSSEKTDARIITASNKSLKKLSDDELFRKDLYYRINVVTIDLPPLRKRKEDIPLLVDHFINHFNHLQGKSINKISKEALLLFMTYNWPGNIRELENVIEHAFILCTTNEIGIQDLPNELTKNYKKKGEKIKDAKKLMEAEIIISTIKKNNNNKTKAAKEMGIHRSTLFRKMKNLNIEI